ncbi:MAG: carbohydrate kinase family protein [Nitriliruptoraceae bacterium]
MSPSRSPRSSNEPRVVCAGIAVADVVVHPVRQPLPLGQLQLVEGIELHAGGCALTTGSALGALTVDVGLTAAVGDDTLGRFLVQIAQDRGIDRGGIVQLEGVPTSSTVVVVDEQGERTFLHLPGCSAHLLAAHVRASLAADLEWLHLGGLLVTEQLDGEPAAALLRDAKQRGARVSADVVWDARDRWQLVHPCLEHLDLFTPSEDEALAISGRSNLADAATWLHDHGVEVVAITRGSHGAYLSNGTDTWHVPAAEVVVRDGTGAGDCFVAGMIAGMLAGWQLPRAAAQASVLGGVAVASVGAPTQYPDPATLRAATDALLDRIRPS